MMPVDIPFRGSCCAKRPQPLGSTDRAESPTGAPAPCDTPVRTPVLRAALPHLRCPISPPPGLYAGPRHRHAGVGGIASAWRCGVKALQRGGIGG